MVAMVAMVAMAARRVRMGEDTHLRASGRWETTNAHGSRGFKATRPAHAGPCPPWP